MRLAVDAVVEHAGQLLLIEYDDARLGRHWGLPGGGVEPGEGIHDAVRREVAEETGLEAVVTGYGPFTNDIFVDEGKHYVTLFVLASAPEGLPQVMEPEKCAEWRWCAWDALPSPLFLSVQHLLELGYRPPGV